MKSVCVCERKVCECLWISSHERKKKKSVFKGRAICERDRKRDESRELRGSTFTLAFVPTFSVVLRWLRIVCLSPPGSSTHYHSLLSVRVTPGHPWNIPRQRILNMCAQLLTWTLICMCRVWTGRLEPLHVQVCVTAPALIGVYPYMDAVLIHFQFVFLSQE